MIIKSINSKKYKVKYIEVLSLKKKLQDLIKKEAYCLKDNCLCNPKNLSISLALKFHQQKSVESKSKKGQHPYEIKENVGLKQFKRRRVFQSPQTSQEGRSSPSRKKG